MSDIALQAGERYDAAVRRSFWLLVAFAFIHITVFGPSAQLHRRLSESEDRQAYLKSIQDQTKTLSDSLKEFRDACNGHAVLLKELQSDLQGDFKALRQDLRPLVHQNLKKYFAREDLGLDPFRLNTTRIDTSQFGPLPRNKPPVARFVFDEATKVKIKEAKAFEELKTAILPKITSEIVKARFDELQIKWQASAFPTIEKVHGRASTLLEGLIKEYPDGSDLLRTLEKQLTETHSKAASVNFSPPKDDTWWMTLEGKRLQAQRLEEIVSSELVGALRAKSIAGDLGEAVDTTIAQEGKVAAELKTRLTELEETFESQKENLANLATPFSYLAMDFRFVISRFPLLLGGVLALALAWPAYWRRRIVLAATVSEATSRQDTDVWVRYFGSGLADIVKGNALRVVLYLIPFVWVAFVTGTVFVSRLAPPGEAVLYGVLGAVLVGVALVYREMILRIPKPIPPPAPVTGIAPEAPAAEDPPRKGKGRKRD